jgi:hypothetical protein
MSEKTNVDTKVMDILKRIGYTALDFNYGYSIPADGNSDIKPDTGKKYLSKNLKESRMEMEFCIFSKGNRKANRNKRLVIVEDKKEENCMGTYDNMSGEVGLYKYALTDLYHYAIELLSKTKDVKEIFGIAVA